MKVYVITKGCYSDYHICAVTLDEQEAKRLEKVYSETNERAAVEEYDTDAPEAKLGLDGRVPYHVRFHKDYTYVCMSYKTPEEFKPHVFLDPHWDIVDVFATDSDAAVKIAAEKRAQARAEREGIV